jgi:hypothetical protein
VLEKDRKEIRMITESWKRAYGKIKAVGVNADRDCDRCPAAKVCVQEWDREMSHLERNGKKADLVWEFPCGEIIEGKDLP